MTKLCEESKLFSKFNDSQANQIFVDHNQMTSVRGKNA